MVVGRQKEVFLRGYSSAYFFLTMSALSVRKPRIEDASFCAESSISLRAADFRIAFVVKFGSNSTYFKLLLLQSINEVENYKLA